MIESSEKGGLPLPAAHEDPEAEHNPDTDPAQAKDDEVNSVRHDHSEQNGDVISESKSEKDEKEENPSQMLLSEILKINKSTVDFGELFPGQIIEEQIVIGNSLSKKKIHFKIKINCLTKEFDELDEYVYSMRRPTNSENFNYNDVFLILLAPKTLANFKLAIKVPSIRAESEILGNVEISSSDAKLESIIIPIKSKIILPSIKLEKMIYFKSLGRYVLKLYMKNMKKQDFRISMKSSTKIAVPVEYQIMKHDKFRYLDVNFYPPAMNLNPNFSSIFLMQVKSTLTEDEKEDKEVNALLLVKLKNATPIFSFPIIFVFGE